MTERDYAWAAGLFDGEGSTFLKHGRRGCTLAVQLAQSGEDIPTLERFFDVANVGRLYGPYEMGERRAPQVRWTAHGAEAMIALRLMWPHLSRPKRAQATAAIEKWNQEIGARPNRRSHARASVSVSEVERKVAWQRH